MVSSALKFSVASLVASASLASVLIGTSTASASASQSGAGGGAYAGETLVATAWESSIGAFTIATTPALHTDESDVYQYRVALSDDTIVDYQATNGLSPLTAEEQSQWYIDSGLAPYEFTWMAFYCPTVRVTTPADPVPVSGDPGINLESVVTYDASQATGFPSFTEEQFGNWSGPVMSGTIFGGDVSLYVPEFQSMVATPLLLDDDSFWMDEAVTATSYLNLTCPDGYAPYSGRILNSSMEADYATGRSLSVGASLFIEPSIGIVRVNPVFELESANTYIAVVGDRRNVNAALWGVTRINPGVRALPNTGLDMAAMWATVGGSLIVMLSGASLIATRRRSSR